MKKLIGVGFLFILLVAGLFLSRSVMAQRPLGVGDKIPSFSLKDQFGQEFDIKDHLGESAMVIYFYPKDDTPGCTKEACSFRDSYQDFTDRNIKVIGISSDDVESHRNFAEKYQLPFTLLADTENRVREQFGVKSDFLGLLPGRVTYVTEPNGTILFIHESQFRAESHIEEALKALEEHGY